MNIYTHSEAQSCETFHKLWRKALRSKFKEKKKHGHLSMFSYKIFKKCLLFSDIPFAIDVNAVRAAYANHKIETENKLYDLALLMKAYCVSVSIDQNK